MSSTRDRLQEILKVRDMKQSDILHLCEPYCKAYGVKITKSGLSQYCAGIITPKQDKVNILAMALNVNEGWLMGYDVPMERKSGDYISSAPKPSCVSSPVPPPEDPVTAEILNAVRSMPAEQQQQQVLDYVQYLASREHK